MARSNLSGAKAAKGLSAALEKLEAAAPEKLAAEDLDTLQEGLAAESNKIVAKAAELAAQFNAEQLAPSLTDAFDRLMGEAIASDKHCLAKTAIVKALHAMRIAELNLFLRGMSFYSPTPPRRGEPDEAASLRIECVSAHADLAHARELEPLLEVLFDPTPAVRETAVKGIIAMGGAAGKLLIRLKTLTGDEHIGVIDACFAGLLDDETGDQIPFVARYLDSGDDHKRAAAALALAESGHKGVFDILAAAWKRTHNSEFKRDLIIAISIIRGEPSRQFLYALIETKGGYAADAISALSSYRSNPEISQHVKQAVQRSGDVLLQRLFGEKFA